MRLGRGRDAGETTHRGYRRIVAPGIRQRSVADGRPSEDSQEPQERRARRYRKVSRAQILLLAEVLAVGDEKR